MIDEETTQRLDRMAWEIRRELVESFGYGKAHHYGGCLSCVEILTVLYFYKMRYSFALRSDPLRDRFIMSKGHSIPVQYVILSRLGFFPRGELGTIKTLGTRLQGHPDINKTPGIEAPTGSLGQGLSFANGIALAGRLDGKNFSVYVLCGDGELQEGQVWEAAMMAAHYRLNGIRLIVDNNKYQSQGNTGELMGVEPLIEKFESFGWAALRVHGHDVGSIARALDSLDGSERPGVIVADTVKGRGIPFMENTWKFHNYALSEEEYRKALAELEA